MTNLELSNEFDVLYNNITSNQAPGLDEYEKSVFLTNAQDDIIKAYFNPRQNRVQQGFDESQKRQIDFSSLMKTKTLDESLVNSKFDSRSITYRMPSDLLLFVNEACQDKNYRYVVIPISYQEYDRLMLKPYQYPIKRGVWRLIVNSATPDMTSKVQVGSGVLAIENFSTKKVTFTIKVVSTSIPTEQDSDGTILSMENVGYCPSIQETADSVYIECKLSSSLPNTSRYWSYFIIRPNLPWSDTLYKYIGDMSGNSGSGNSIFPAVSPSVIGDSVSVTAEACTPIIELIGRIDKDSISYTVRYIRKPRPIILTNLDDELSIQGISKESTCELDESIHYEILQRAVELAKAAYIGDLTQQVALGQSSKTDIGVIAQSR